MKEKKKKKEEAAAAAALKNKEYAQNKRLFCELKLDVFLKKYLCLPSLEKDTGLDRQ